MADGEKRPRFFVPAEGDFRHDAAAGKDAVAEANAAADAPAFFQEGLTIALPDTEAHHAAHVLRLGPGSPVELFDGMGGSCMATIARAHHGQVTAVVEQVGPRSARPAPIIELAFAVPKGRRLDWLLEKATELGVASLAPVRFERSVAGPDQLSAAARQRWLTHCIAAAKQACSDFLPAIHQPQDLGDFLVGTHRTPGFYGDAAAAAQPIARVMETAGRAAQPSDPVTLVVGPEGGLTEAEMVSLRQAGFTGVRLGHTTLRVETAALALAAVAVALYFRD